MYVFTENKMAILSAISEFLNYYFTLTDSSVFQIKSFLFDFLINSKGINNTFTDKKIAFKIIEFFEVYKTELTGN
jgi:hypothetical protein